MNLSVIWKKNQKDLSLFKNDNNNQWIKLNILRILLNFEQPPHLALRRMNNINMPMNFKKINNSTSFLITQNLTLSRRNL